MGELQNQYTAITTQPVEEAMERQREECDLCDEPEQLLGALATIKKRKAALIKEYEKAFENYQEW